MKAALCCGRYDFSGYRNLNWIRNDVAVGSADCGVSALSGKVSVSPPVLVPVLLPESLSAG